MRAAADADHVVAAVAELLRSQDAGPRLAAAETLARIAEVASITPAVPALLATLPAVDDNTAPTFLRALALSSAPDALMPLLERLSQSQSQSKPEQLTPALEALQLYFDRGRPDGRAADPLLGQLGTASAAQRVMIVDLLGRVGAPRAVPALAPLVTSDDRPLQLAAIRSLGALGAAEAAPALVPLLDDNDATAALRGGARAARDRYRRRGADADRAADVGCARRSACAVDRARRFARAPVGAEHAYLPRWPTPRATHWQR